MKQTIIPEMDRAYRRKARRILTGGNLSVISLDDYARLLRKFPNHMLTHVVRQGVRDHSGPDHYGGSLKFHNGLKELLKDED